MFSLTHTSNVNVAIYVAIQANQQQQQLHVDGMEMTTFSQNKIPTVYKKLNNVLLYLFYFFKTRIFS